MAYKSIVVHVDDTAGVEARIRLAAHLACESNSRLIGSAAGHAAPLASLQARGTTLIAVGIGEEQDSAGNAAARQIFETTANPFGLATSWSEPQECGAAGLARSAALADLLVCGFPATGREAFPVGEFILRAGRPVLVAPAGMDSLGHRHAVVAWKNTREARRALADALPLLARFVTVTLAHAAEASGEPDLQEAADFLSQHGIVASQTVLREENQTAAERLAGYVREVSADLIVLGAFGRSRPVEWLFGGVTTDLLAGCKVPCLFSH